MSDESVEALTNSLLWHLETRNWARKKLSFEADGKDAHDVKIYHHLYLENAIATIDIVSKYFRTQRFGDLVRANLATSGDFDYARELRNAVFHRDISLEAARSTGAPNSRSLCPNEVFSHDGRRRHVCSFAYTDDFAHALDLATNAATVAVLDASNLFDPSRHAPDRERTLAVIGAAPNMPEYAKAWVDKTLRGADGDRVISEMAEGRVRRLRSLLSDPS